MWGKNSMQVPQLQIGPKESCTYLTVLSNSMYAFAGVNSPLTCYRSPTGADMIANTSACIALKNGRKPGWFHFIQGNKRTRLSHSFSHECLWTGVCEARLGWTLKAIPGGK